jgi:hypothetical protein
MEALAAISLAGNILQFVDFARVLLSNCVSLYRSRNGCLSVNAELELITTDLRALVSKWRYARITGSADELVCLTQAQSEEQKAFESICEGAEDIAKEIISKLESLKVKGRKGDLKETVKKAVKSLWTEGEIDVLVGRLAAFKEALQTRVILNLRYVRDRAYLQNSDFTSKKLDSQALAISDLFNAIDTQSQALTISLLENSNSTSSDTANTLARLISRLEATNRDEHQRTRDLIIQSFNNNDEKTDSGVDQVTAEVEMLIISKGEEEKIRSTVCQQLLESLSYSEMSTRYEEVVQAHSTTFHWIFCEPTTSQRPWHSFVQWLRGEGCLYWIAGKAGAGKSTLMKYILEDNRTKQYLEIWAREHQPAGSSLCFANFFFWNSGSVVQRSQKGLLRALLHQVLERFPDLGHIVFPERWAKIYSATVDNALVPRSATSWSLSQLEHGMEQILHQKRKQLQLFILIDGLDEFEGDHEEISIFFRDLVNRNPWSVKICLSSRPLVSFQHVFRGFPCLHLQDLTQRDIYKYVTEKLHSNNSFRTLARQDHKSASELITEILDAADGVFLWVKLVINSLLRGLRNLDDMSDLQRRLREFPTELESLYAHIMSKIEPCYLEWASKTFQIARAARELDEDPFKEIQLWGGRGQPKLRPRPQPLTLSALYLSLHGDVQGPTWLDKDHPALNFSRVAWATLEVRLTARCAGLLEVPPHSIERAVGPLSPVVYLHRTARDFLERPKYWPTVLAYISRPIFDPQSAMMKAYACSLMINHDADGRREEILQMKQRARTMLLSAYHVYSSSVPQVANIALFDSSDKIMALNTGPYPHWSNVMLSNELIGMEIPHFLACATLFNLNSYVNEKLSQTTQSTTPRKASRLLACLLDNMDFKSGARLPLPSITMISILIRHGADPNYKERNSNSLWWAKLTAWENCLKQCSLLFAQSNIFRCLSLEVGYLSILKALLLAGGDHNIEVSREDDKYEGLKLPVLDFVKEVLSPNVSAESKQIVTDIKIVLDKNSPPAV